jgi:hypothetical protein
MAAHSFNSHYVNLMAEFVRVHCQNLTQCNLWEKKKRFFPHLMDSLDLDTQLLTCFSNSIEKDN